MGQHPSNAANMTQLETKNAFMLNNNIDWPRGAPRSISQVCRGGPLYKEVSYRSVNMATAGPESAKEDPPKIRLYETSTPLTSNNSDKPILQSPRPSPIGRANSKDQTTKEQPGVNLLLRHYLRLDNASSPLGPWLKELRLTTDSECPSVLQAKSLTKDPDHLAALASRNAFERVRMLQTKLDDLLTDFETLVETLLNADWARFCAAAKNFVRLVAEALLSHRRGSTVAPSHPEVCLMRNCQDLVETLGSASCKKGLKRKLSLLLTSLKDVVDFFTVQQITVVVGGLDTCHERCLKTSLAALTSIGQLGESMCRMATRAGAIEALLALSTNAKWRLPALRLCTLLCCVPEAVSRLESAGGIAIATDIICQKERYEESSRSEAAGLLAQITTPNVDNSGATLRSLPLKNLDKLVASLTDLARKTRCSESLLLASAALANLSFLEDQASFQNCQTARHLIDACKWDGSLFVKDQVATVLANMAVKNAETVVSSGGLVQLLCFLQSRPSPLQSSHEVKACERLLQKSCVALARLCASQPVCRSALAEMKAPERLVRLCTDPKERNHSDAILVAALTTLRQVASACIPSEIEKLDAKQLIEPSLWDSFLTFCSNQETFV